MQANKSVCAMLFITICMQIIKFSLRKKLLEKDDGDKSKKCFEDDMVVRYSVNSNISKQETLYRHKLNENE